MLVLLKATSACNMQCRYCSESTSMYTVQSSYISYEVCEHLVAQLLPLLHEGERVQLLWHGGEPTVLPVAHFAHLHEFLLQSFTEKGHTVKGSMQTNALEISQEWRESFRYFDIQPGVSLDGPDFLHDSMRITASGGSSYAYIAQNLRMLLNEGFSPSLLCVVTRKHLQHVPEIIHWLQEWQCAVRFNPLLGVGRSENALTGREYYTFLQELFTMAVQEQLYIPIEPLEWMFEAILFDKAPTECSVSGACGQNILAVHQNGDISACGRCSARFGNILQTNIAELMQMPPWQERRNRQQVLNDVCGTCNIRLWCHGGCPEAHGFFPNAEDCNARHDFFAWLEQDGLTLLKKVLVQEKAALQGSLDVLHTAQKELYYV